MNIHTRALIKVRCQMATPKLRDPQADARFDEYSRQDVMVLLAEIERLEKKLALARMRAAGRAGRMPR